MVVRSVDEARTVFETSAVVTRLFLEGRLRGEAAARSALHDPEHIRELSRGLATVTQKRP